MNDLVDLIEQAIRERKDPLSRNEAFGELVRRFQDMVFGYAYSLLREEESARDAAQETFIAVYDRLESLANPGAFPAWTKKIAYRVCMRELRNRRRRRDESAGDEEIIPSHYPSPEGSALDGETRREIRSAIDRLPEDQRTSIVLHYIDGYSSVQIAEFLDIEPAAVKKRLQRGRDRMREEFMDTVRNDISGMRPSKDGNFVEKVSLYASFEAAAKLGQTTILEQMLVDGIDLDEADASGRTLLHWAVETDLPDAVALLLRSGADPSIRDRKGRTALRIAKQRKLAHIAALFEQEK